MTITDSRSAAHFLLILGLILLISACTPAEHHTNVLDHDDHDDHGEEGTAEEHVAVHLEPAQLDELGLTLAVASPGVLASEVKAPGEVRINGDRMAHVAPRVAGVVVEVFKSLGDSVRSGEVMAVLHSRELADFQAGYLAADSRLRLANASFEREERLRKEKISSEQDFLDARNMRSEARIALRSAEQKLIALGFTAAEIADMPNHHKIELTRYPLTAPFDGVVIDRHLTQGEAVEADTTVFTVADLSTVWIDLSIYQKDLGTVHAGQEVRLATDHDGEESARISFVQPLVGEDTRTALARVIVANRDGRWHPGCFVTAVVAAEQHEVAVRVPRDALVRLGDEGHTAIFVQEGDEFEAREVETGRSDRDRDLVEIVSGLEAGETYVVEGAFNLKAEMGKSSFGHGHAH